MQTSRSRLGAEEEVPVIGKQVPCKKARSAPPLPKRKPQSGLYASARSSGYGKPSSPLQIFSALEKKTLKDNTKTRSVRSIPISNQFRKKGKNIFFSRQNWIHIVHSLIFFVSVENSKELYIPFGVSSVYILQLLTQTVAVKTVKNG